MFLQEYVKEKKLFNLIKKFLKNYDAYLHSDIADDLFQDIFMDIYFSDLLKLSNTIEKIYPQHKLKQKMESKYGLLFVFFWSFFPIVPTDAVCYAAGASKMNFLRFILAVFLGELIICSFYVFTGSSIINLFI